MLWVVDAPGERRREREKSQPGELSRMDFGYFAGYFCIYNEMYDFNFKIVG